MQLKTAIIPTFTKNLDVTMSLSKDDSRSNSTFTIRQSQDDIEILFKWTNAVKTHFKKLLTLPILLVLFCGNIAFAASSSWSKAQGDGAEVQLIASFYEKDGQRKLIGGLHFKIAHGWKIYGSDDSGFGLPPQMDFSKSKNYHAHRIIWPEAQVAEEKIGKETIKYSFYKHEVILPIEIDLKDVAAATELSLRLDYGLCKDVCVPANAEFKLEISEQIDEKVLAEIQKFYPNSLVLDKTSPPKNNSNKYGLTLIYAMLIAFIGGAILNVMPCVLPVLSIKLISIIKHSNSPKEKIRFAFISTILGILFCFVIFAFLAIVIKLTGNSFGWGLQFQNPYFLISLILILTFFTANLLGIFEISFEQFLATLLNRKISQGEVRNRIFLPNFLSGILAVLLATPCSAPFLGTAISFAITSDASIIFLIFLCIGLGLALPYIILIFSQKPLEYLPKPGEWMLKTKQVMTGLLVATILWLIYVISQNIGNIAAIIIAVISLLLLKSCNIKSTLFRYLSLILLITFALTLPNDFQNRKTQQIEQDALWIKLKEEEIARHIIKGKVVLVDVTADWCLTCKFNKIRVLHDQEIIALLKRGDIIGMRGDITKPDEVIMEYMRRKNRFAIPFNAVYGPGAPNGLVASELLSTSELLKLIKQAQGAEK